MSLTTMFNKLFFNEADLVDFVMPEAFAERITVGVTVIVTTDYREYRGVVLRVDEQRQDAYVRIDDDVLDVESNHWFGFQRLIVESETPAFASV